MHFRVPGRANTVALFIVISLALVFGGLASAADMKPVQKPAAQKPADKIEILSVDPANVRTGPGQSVTVTTSGTSLDKITRVSVLLGNSETGSMKAALGPASPTARQITLRVAPDAKPAKYQVRVTGGNQTVTVPAAVFFIEVVVQQKPVASGPVQQKQTATAPASRQSLTSGAGGTQAPASSGTSQPTSAASGTSGTTAAKPGTTTTAGIKPIVINTEKLTATVKQTGSTLAPNQPVDIKTDKLTATIKETQPALKPNEPVVITAEKLTATIKKTEAGY